MFSQPSIECNFIFYFDSYVVCPSFIDVEFTVSKDDFTNIKIKIIVLYRSPVWFSLPVVSGVRVLSTMEGILSIMLTIALSVHLLFNVSYYLSSIVSPSFI